MTYELYIHLPIFSQNMLRRRFRKSWAYRKLRDNYAWAVRAVALSGQVPKASGRRAVRIERLRTKGQRAFDYDNLVGGAKPLVDALVREGLLVDDSPRWCTREYDEGVHPDGGTRIVLEDID